MLAKVLVVAVAVVAVSCENHIYRLKTIVQHAPPKDYHNSHKEYKEYKEYQPHEHTPLREYHEAPASEEQYKLPESHGQGHAYSSQSIVHHGQAAAYEESHEANTEHVAPVYQYVDENNEEQNAHHAVPQNKYTEVHYPAPAPVHQEYKTVQVPYHKLHSHYQPESHYQQESHEGLSYHHEVPHNAPQHVSHPHHEVPVYHAQESHESHDEPIDYYAYPKYQFEYKVEDPHTGDNKFQHEMRDGDVVKGAYGLHEADGSIRTVEYSSDKHNGFSAIVKHSAPGQHVHIESHHKD